MATEPMTNPAAWPEWKWFDAVEQTLKNAVLQIRASDSPDTSALFPYLDSALESTDSLRGLILQKKLRDSYVIVRVIYETSLNACFILTAPDTLALRASRHAKQKALRNVIRAIEVAGETIFKVQIESAEEILQHPEHRKWLEEFTTKSGREISSWTPENVPQRLDAIYRKFGPADSRGLMFGLLLYRHASEIAHGTLFGTLFSWGAMELGTPLNSSGDMAKFRQKELQHLMKLVVHAHESVIRILASRLQDQSLHEAAVRARNDYYRDRTVDA